MLYEEACGALLAEATVEDYYLERHRMIFEAIRSLSSEDRPVHYLSVAEVLGRKERDKNAALAYLSEMADDCPAGPHMMGYYLGILKEASAQRALLRALQQGQEEVYAMPIEEALELLEGRLELLRPKERGSDMVSAKDAVLQTFSWCESYLEGSITYLRTGFDLLDKLLYIDDQDFVVLAARPSIGKTALALNIAANLCASRVPVLFFSMEMSRRKLMVRLISARSGTDFGAALAERRDSVMDPHIFRVAEEISQWPLTIDDSGRMTPSELCRRAERVQRERPGLGLIVVDYLQELKGEGPEGRQGQVEESSKALKELAKKLRCPVMALCQLNRDSEKRKQPPGMADLRDSGGIEQAADAVLILHRERDAQGEPSEVGELFLRKSRDGRLGKINMRFRGDQQRFEEMW